MYVPKHFSVEDRAVLARVMREHSFATLVSADGEVPMATHVPLLLSEDGATLRGHVARANPHWRLFDGRETLAIFQGPHAYVSPSLYRSSPNVPTWNYVAVHAYGRARCTEDPESVEELLRDTMLAYDGPTREAGLDEATETYFRRIMTGVVAFEMPIERLEGKFKLNQNKQPEDRQAVAEALGSSADGTERGVAAFMREYALKGRL